MPKGVYDRSNNKHKEHDGICSHCHKNPSKRSLGKGQSVWCYDCSNANARRYWSEMSDLERRAKRIKKKYGISLDQYLHMFDERDGKCDICKINMEITYESQQNAACVDHCHLAGAVRGMLCNHCNRALGLVKENAGTVTMMANYIKERCIG